MLPGYWPKSGPRCYANVMDKRLVLLFAGLLAVASTTASAQAYRWVDDAGIVHYSDRPQPGAEQIALPKPNTSNRLSSRSSNTTRSNPSADAAEKPKAPVRYESFTVVSPAPEETLWNIDGALNVSLALSPALQPGHQVRVYFDGQARIVTSANFQLENVYRGAHNLQAEILDETGKLMIRSQASRFYVQQNKVQF